MSFVSQCTVKEGPQTLQDRMAPTIANDKKNEPGKLAKLRQELDALNKVGLGNVSICKYDVTTAESKTLPAKKELAVLVHGLYSLAKKCLEVAESNEAPLATEQKRDSVQSIQEVIGLIKTEIVSILPGLVNDVVEGKLSQNGITPSVTRNDDIATERHTLEVEKIANDDEQDDIEMTENLWTTRVKKDVTKSLRNIPVVRANASRKGTAMIEFKSKEDMEEASRSLETNYRVTTKTAAEKKLDPKITVNNIDSEITADSLEGEILSKNESIKSLKDSGETFEKVFFDGNERFAVFKVSPKIREALKNNQDKICIGLQMHTIRDRFHVVQCFHCQGFGHKFDSCKHKDSDPVCFYCAGSHKSKDCNFKKERKENKIKCSNCAHSKIKSEKDNCKTHKASDTLCPIFIKEKERMMDRTACATEAKNAYQQDTRPEDKAPKSLIIIIIN